ncbi:MAG: hypothetical protein ISS01_03220 [Nanoarchaeota archaeon]|nr:hypothetical protein [Nanoarchaeota archaeon]
MTNKNEDKQNNKWYTISDLVRLSAVGLFPCKSKIHINRLLESGKLKGIDIGVKSLKQWRISKESISDFINGESNPKD